MPLGICQPCQDGATEMLLGNTEFATRLHEQCPGGTWCLCHHSVSGSAMSEQDQLRRNLTIRDTPAILEEP
jgi:hypothetical protein